jgi:hypothetical protein
MAATEVAIFTPEQWAERLLTLYPYKWTGDAARVAGGILYSIFQAPSSQSEYLQANLDWVLDATRIATARDEALDAIALDYFGAVKPFTQLVTRQPGEPDSSFRQRIYANLLAPGGTRADIKRVLELLTGQTPRIIEPWNVYDTASCDTVSYCDIDTVANPGRPSDLQMEGQGFVESVLPSYADQGNFPAYCADVNAYADRCFVLDPAPTWFMNEKELDAAINRVKMFGTVVWRAYGTSLKADYQRGNSLFLASGRTSVPVRLYPPTTQALVVLACATWNSVVSAKNVDNGNFILDLATASPGGMPVDWIAAPITVPGYGLLPIAKDATGANLAIPIENSVLLVTPNWNSSVWVNGLQTSLAAFEFSNPAPEAARLNYACFKHPYGGVQVVPAGENTAHVSFALEIPLPHQLILMGGWNTQFETVKSQTGFTVTFSTTPDQDTFFYWGVLYQPY